MKDIASAQASHHFHSQEPCPPPSKRHAAKKTSTGITSHDRLPNERHWFVAAGISPR